jgi:hypothetical protein
MFCDEEEEEEEVVVLYRFKIATERPKGHCFCGDRIFKKLSKRIIAS